MLLGAIQIRVGINRAPKYIFWAPGKSGLSFKKYCALKNIIWALELT